MRRRTVSLCAAVTAALSTSSAFAGTDYFWLAAPANTNVQELTNYSTAPNAVSGDQYNVGGGASVNFPGTGALTFSPGKLRIGNGSAATNPGDATLTMTGGTMDPGGLNSGTPIGTDAGLGIGINAVGVMIQTGGSVLVTRHIIIGSDNTTNNTGLTPGSGTLTMSNASTIRTTAGDAFIGSGNPGFVSLSDTASFTVLPSALSSTLNANLTVGDTVASTFTMSGSSVVSVCNSLQIGSGSTFTMNGGTVSTRTRNTLTIPAYATNAANGNLNIGTNAAAGSTFTMNNGTLNVGNQMTVGQSTSVGATFTIVNGTLTTEAVNVTGATGNITVGSATSSGATMNIQGGTVVNNHRFLVGGGTSTGSVVNQSAGTVTVDLSIRVSDTTTASATYNLSGGSLSTGTELSFVGRQGTGTMNHSLTGIANFNSGLAIGDDAGAANPATGTYQISGGELHATLAGNAIRIGTAGTGTLRVVGDDGLIDVNGNMLVGNTVKGVGTLAYQFEAGDLLSVVDVSGTATFNAGSALVADTSVASPTQRAYDVLTATNVVDNGVVDSAGWTHRVVNGGANGKLLQIAQTGTFYWDIDDANPGGGGATPNGTWNSGTNNLSADSTGSSSTSPLSTAFGDDVVFGAGTDGTGTYTVTVSGTQSAKSVAIARGDVTLAGGALDVPVFNVDPSAFGTVVSDVTNTAGDSITKTGNGPLLLVAANEFTGGVNVQGGTLMFSQGIKGNGPLTIADGATALVTEGAPNTYNPPTDVPSGDNSKGSKVSALNIAPTGTLDLGNSDMAVDYADPNTPLDTVKALLVSGFNGGGWDGPGITSFTISANNPNQLDPSIFGLGYAENGALPVPYGNLEAQGGPLFSDQDVDLTTVLIKFTWIGDLNLDGFVDFQDLSVFNTNYDNGASSGRYWFEGDFNYDGFIDFSDLSLFNTNYDPSKPSLPEPAGIALLLPAILGLRGRRRAGR